MSLLIAWRVSGRQRVMFERHGRRPCEGDFASTETRHKPILKQARVATYPRK